MNDLIERIEAASAESAERDELGIAINEALDIASYITDDGDPTQSIDAALTLVPKDSWIEIKGPRKYLNIPTPVPAAWSAEVSRWDHEGQGVGWAATPALALCAAALKARAYLKETNNAD